jgi:tetratricopeptide (TPR) repeat protein
MGDSTKARKYMAAGMAAEDTPPEVVYNYGVSLLKEKRYSDAARELRRVVEARPDMAPAWQALALSLRLGKRYPEAVEAYQQAIALQPDAKMYFNLALCYSRLRQTDDAVQNYRKAISLDPRFNEAYHNMCNTLIGAKRYSEALEALDEFLKIEPNSYRIYFNQGLCLYHLQRYEEAIEKYELALEQKETADAFNNLGLVYDKMGNKEEAKALYREAQKVQGGK